MGESERYMDFKNKGSYKKRTPFTLGDPNNAVMSIVTVNIIFFFINTSYKGFLFIYPPRAGYASVRF